MVNYTLTGRPQSLHRGGGDWSRQVQRADRPVTLATGIHDCLKASERVFSRTRAPKVAGRAQQGHSARAAGDA